MQRVRHANAQSRLKPLLQTQGWFFSDQTALLRCLWQKAGEVFR